MIPPMRESFWQKESLLQYTLTLPLGPKHPVLPTLLSRQDRTRKNKTEITFSVIGCIMNDKSYKHLTISQLSDDCLTRLRNSLSLEHSELFIFGSLILEFLISEYFIWNSSSLNSSSRIIHL